ncbi:MAG: PBP1A family penicillin-binding protein [Paracoccaceae bacterium]
MIRVVLSFFGALFSFATIGFAMAVLMIGAMFWMYARDLPNHEELANYAPKTISRIYSGEGRLIDEFAEERRLFAPADEIPDLVKEAFISAEDKNFYHHHGYDARGIMAAAFEAIKSRGKNVRGASTITQQVMKNFLLGGERKAERKIKEIILATRIEDSLSKDKILELYLNEIYLGANSYGVAAAAQTYFNKTLAELKPEEAAYLAALPKKPADLHPVRDHDAAVQRRNYVLREMYQNGYLDKQAYETAHDAPLKSVQNGDFEPFRDTLPPRDYFTDEIRRQLSKDFGHGEFFGGGLTIRATIDPEMQGYAAKALRDGLEEYDRSRGTWRGTGKSIPEDKLKDEGSWRAALAAVDVARDIKGWHPAVVLKVEENSLTLGVEGVESTAAEPTVVPRDDIAWLKGDFFDNFKVGDVIQASRLTDKDGNFLRWSARQVPELQGGFMAMDVNTGRVIAMQGGFSYQDSVFNRATQATRQPGSSFKPFVYAAALDSGFTPATIVIDAPIEVDTGNGIWRPKNSSNKFYGPTPLRTGIVHSRNLMTVRIAQEVGMNTVAGYAERFGVYDRMEPFLANALGSQETTLYRMVAAYAMFANGGERVEPTLVDRVQDRYGKTIYRHDPRHCEDCSVRDLPKGEAPLITSDRERIINAITAYQLTSMMRGVVERGTAAGRVNLPVPTAGKTGTTNDSRDVWFIGFTSNIVAGCYMGFDNPRPMGHGAYGASMCGPVFTQFMQHAVEKFGGGAFKVPPGGHFINIDRYTGARLPPEASGENVVAEYFRDGEEPVFGMAGLVDGGFAMGSGLPLFKPGESDDEGQQVTTSTGKKTTVGPKAGFGTLSSGGLY